MQVHADPGASHPALTQEAYLVTYDNEASLCVGGSIPESSMDFDALIFNRNRHEKLICEPSINVELFCAFETDA